MIKTNNTSQRRHDNKVCNGELIFKYKLPDLDRTMIFYCKRCFEETELI